MRRWGTFPPRTEVRGIRYTCAPTGVSSIEKLKFLLRYAILAPSSFNTQPWKFSIGEDEIQVFADKIRWLKVSDPDQRELYISTGCALENLLIAAEHFGYGHQVVYLPDPDKEELAATIKFITQGQPSLFRGTTLFNAIPVRYTNHKIYEERHVPPDDLKRLQDCCVEECILLYMTSDLEIKRKVDRLITCGDAILFSNPAYREELGYWIGQGVFGEPWLMAKLTQFAITHIDMGKRQAKEDSKALMSASVLAVLGSKVNDKESQIKTGQVFERICLVATDLGISTQPMSQIVEIPEFKAVLMKLIQDSDSFAQHIFRMGYAEQEKGHTPRRSLEEVLV